MKKPDKMEVTYLGSSRNYPLESTPPVYMVASYRIDENSTSLKWNENRTWGWLPTLEHARKAVKMNSGDMHETTFNYVIIEKVPAGICVLNEIVEVYKWQPDKTDKNNFRGKWVKCKKPKCFENVLNLTIG